VNDVAWFLGNDDAVASLRVERPIGRSGSGELYLARDTRLDRPVALKVLPGDAADALGPIDWMLGEARVASMLNHPAIVAIYDVGVHRDRVFIAMEFVEGETLDELIARRGPLPVGEAVALFAQLGDGLAAAHDAGILHGDLRPGNAMLDSHGYVRILNVGIHATSAVAPRAIDPAARAWLAPEAAERGYADVRSEVFSLGVLLHFLLTARLPGDIAVPAMPAAISGVVRSALRRDPTQRPGDVRAFVAAVRGATRRSRWRVWSALGVGAVGMAVATIVATGGGADAEAPVSMGSPSLPPPSVLPERVVAMGGCAFTPAFVDERTLVFDLTRDGAVDLYRVDLDDRVPVRLTRDPGWEWQAGPGRTSTEVLFQRLGARTSIDSFDLATGARSTVIPDGYVAAAHGDAIYYTAWMLPVVRRMRGTHDKVVAVLPDDDAASLAISPDGRWLAAVTRGNNNAAKLCLVDTASGAMRCETTTPGTARAAFSADGTSLYTASAEAIVRVRLPDGPQHIAVRAVRGFGGITVSPSGAVMAWSDCAERGVLIDTGDSATSPVVVTDALWPTFGPAGLFAYVTRSPDRERLLVRTPDGAVRVVAETAGGRIARPAFSADGRRIAFPLVGGDSGIHVATIDGGGAPLRISDNERDTQPIFVGGDVVFTRPDPRGMSYVMRVAGDGGDPRRLSGRPRLGVAAVGDRLLVSTPNQSGFRWWDARTGEDVAGPRLTMRSAYPALSPNGQWFAYVDRGARTHVRRLRLDGRSAPELMYSMADDELEQNLAVSDDGRVVVGVLRWSGDLWLARAPAGSRW
jgi:hypothetical protein